MGMAELENVMDDVPESLDSLLPGTPGVDEQHEMGRLEAKLESLRGRILKKAPWTSGLLGEVDIKIGLAQGFATVVGAVSMNYMLYAAGASAGLAALGPYTAIMAASTAIGALGLAAGYVLAHYLMNRRYRGREKELFREALRFTAVERATFIPSRLASLCLENLLVGFGVSRYICGNVIPSVLLTFQGLGSNRAGKEMNRGGTIGDAFAQGMKQVGHLLYLPVAGLRSAYDSIAGRIRGYSAMAQPADAGQDVPLGGVGA